jgi:hypothetical protein
VVVRTAVRGDLARWDHEDSARAQLRILRGLVHQAQATRFGRDHDFRRIRTVGDFRRLVPMRSWADLWREYWQPGFPRLMGTTWPAGSPLAILPSLDVPRPVVLCPALLRARRAALRAAAAQVATARPTTRFLEGTILCLDDPLVPISLGQETVGPGISLTDACVPGPLRPCVLSVPWSGAAGASVVAQRAAWLPITCLVGSARHVLRVVKAVKKYQNRTAIQEVWPGLEAVLISVTAADPSVAPLRAELGDEVFVVECHLRPEAPLAIEDARHPGLLRLLDHHGVYFEFVPEAEVWQLAPTRHGVDDVTPDVPYEVAVTSPAGLWSCRLGVTVCFERRNPPLLRLVSPAPAPSLAVPAARQDQAALTAPAPHRRSAGTPAAPPESFVHIPWSARADRE